MKRHPQLFIHPQEWMPRLWEISLEVLGDGWTRPPEQWVLSPKEPKIIPESRERSDPSPLTHPFCTEAPSCLHGGRQSVPFSGRECAGHCFGRRFRRRPASHAASPALQPTFLRTRQLYQGCQRQAAQAAVIGSGILPIGSFSQQHRAP